jgi:pilus assembly protein CpaB
VGDWITKGKLTERGEFGFVGQIPPGMRVKTIPVDATQIHSGMLRPGNRIDILLSYVDKGVGRTIQKTRTVLEYVEVFAVDNHVYGTGDKEGGTSAKNISLLVTPEQGALLDLCMNKGKLSTTLRSTADKGETGTLELTDEAFGNALSGTDSLNDSMMAYRDQLNESGPSIDDLNDSEYSIAGQLEDELNDPEGSGPLVQLADASEIVPKNVWIMEIHEGPNVRLESITIPEPEQTEATETEPQPEQTEQSDSDLSTEAPESGSFWDFLRAKP